jgi:phage tail-like protein
MGTSAPDLTVSPQQAKLELTGITTVFNTVSGYSVTLNVEATPDGTTPQGDPTWVYRMAGLPNYGDLMCEAQLSKTDTSLFTWWQELSAGTVTPKDGTLTLSDAAGKPQATFSIKGALMNSLVVSDHGVDNPTYATISATLNCLSYDRTQ